MESVEPFRRLYIILVIGHCIKQVRAIRGALLKPESGLNGDVQIVVGWQSAFSAALRTPRQTYRDAGMSVEKRPS